MTGSSAGKGPLDLVGPFVWYAEGADGGLPAIAGAYLLVLSLPQVVWFRAPKIGEHRLLPGMYLYAGSARGPGGLRGRLCRHFKREKKMHWHIDQLTIRSDVLGAYISTACSECDIVDVMLKTGIFAAIVDGIGSTDCRRCRSHLLGRVQS